MKQTFKSVLVLSAAVVSLLFFSTVTQAANNPGKNIEAQQVKASKEPRPEPSSSNNGGEKLNNSCENKVANFQRKAEQITERSTKMREQFDSIAQRVMDYYETKVVPSGIEVAGYSDLTGDIEAAQSDVTTAIADAESQLLAVTCEGDDTKLNMSLYKEELKLVNTALKDYRTSIKNLIVAVRSSKGNHGSAKQEMEDSTKSAKEDKSNPGITRSPKPEKSLQQGGKKP